MEATINMGLLFRRLAHVWAQANFQIMYYNRMDSSKFIHSHNNN